MAGRQLAGASDLLALFNGQQQLRWLPGLALALTISIGARYWSYAVALPTALLGAICFFYGLSFYVGETADTLAQSGWLLGPLDMAHLDVSALVALPLLEADHWQFLLAYWPDVGTILIISAISILLTVSALELISGRESDINRELRVAGLANIAAGLGGGIVGFHSLSVSSLALKLGGSGRLTGAIAALTCGVALLVGTHAIGLMPRFVAGGLLISLGFSFLAQWLLGSFARLPFGEYLLVPLIVAIVASVGFVEGVLAGFVAAVAIFVVSYSRIQVIHHELTGDMIQSSVERNLDDERYLRHAGKQVHILKVGGYIFFGTANQLVARLLERLADPAEPPLTCVLIDFGRVTGIDSSAAYTFDRLRQLAAQHRFVLVLSGIQHAHAHRMRLAAQFARDEHVLLCTDLDHALEWCENRLLEAHAGAHARSSKPILGQVADQYPQDPGGVTLLSYLSEIRFQRGQVLIEQGHVANDLYFLESGEVSVFVQRSDGVPARIRRTGPGTIFGELGFYLNLPRTASVVADRPGTAFRLTVASLELMERDHPGLAAVLHRFMAKLLAERLASTTRTLQSVLD
jgi:SulP family sulfate permease